MSDRPARTGHTPPFRRKASAPAVELNTCATDERQNSAQDATIARRPGSYGVSDAEAASARRVRRVRFRVASGGACLVGRRDADGDVRGRRAGADQPGGPSRVLTAKPTSSAVFQPSGVLGRAALALAFSRPALGRQAPLPRGRGGPGGATALGGSDRPRQTLAQAGQSQLAVACLRAPVLRDRHHSRPYARQHSLPLCVGQRGRGAYVEACFYTGSSDIGVLSPRA